MERKANVLSHPYSVDFTAMRHGKRKWKVVRTLFFVSRILERTS